MHAHNVFFSLRDNSPAAIAATVADCHKCLSGHPGEVFFAVGTVSAIDRPVSDRDYDVALHIVFTDKAAHDAYAVAPRHQQFIAANQANWTKVRVFDSAVEGR